MDMSDEKSLLRRKTHDRKHDALDAAKAALEKLNGGKS